MSEAIAVNDRAKILVMRQDRIGDVFVSTPVLHALRERFPHAQIDFLLSRNNAAALFAIEPLVNKIHVLHKNSMQMLLLLWRLRSSRYDVLVDLNHTASSTSNLLIRCTGARRSIVLKTSRPTPATDQVPQGDRSVRHIIDVLCDLVLPLGIDIASEDRRPRVPIRHDIMNEVRAKLQAGVSNQILGVQISGSSTDRIYPNGALEQVISTISRQFPAVKIVVLSAPSDRPRAEALAAHTGTEYVDPGQSYQHFAAAIACCAWLLSPDTAAIHVAAAHNVPSVVLFSRDHRGFLNWLPYNSPCWPIITEEASLSSIAPELVIGKVASMMTC
jgi:ADP-heptose:LPS heptosyltransferase